jgi:RNA polymerase sigma-70 factor (ECF subfamily)
MTEANPDVELLAAALRGEPAAWRALLARFRRVIYACVAKVAMRCPARVRLDFDDAYAEVLLQLVANDMRRLRRFDPHRGVPLSSWIGMIASQVTHDIVRRAACRPCPEFELTGEDLHDDWGPTPLTQLLEREYRAQLDPLLVELTDRERQFVELYYRRDLDPDEVAKVMHIRRTTVHTKNNKLHARLRRVYAQRRAAQAIDHGRGNLARWQ